MHRFPAVATAICLALVVTGCNADPSPAAATPATAEGLSADARALEHSVQTYLAAAVQRVASPACLTEDQQRWQQDTQQRCGRDAACLATANVQRARLLEGVVPGALLSPALDAHDTGSRISLLAVTGGHGDIDTTADDFQALEPAVFEGVPLADEGGYVLVSQHFDRSTYQDFLDHLGDEDALRERFGEGPVVIDGLLASFPDIDLDVGDHAALDQAAAAGQTIRVSGWAFPAPDATPAIDARRCMFVYRLTGP